MYSADSLLLNLLYHDFLRKIELNSGSLKSCPRARNYHTDDVGLQAANDTENVVENSMDYSCQRDPRVWYQYI